MSTLLVELRFEKQLTKLNFNWSVWAQMREWEWSLNKINKINDSYPFVWQKSLKLFNVLGTWGYLWMEKLYHLYKLMSFFQIRSVYQ